MATRQDRLRAVLTQYYKEPATVDAVLAMYNAIEATTAVLTQDVSNDDRVAVGQMLFDMSTGLSTNPFMAQYGTRIVPVFQAAVNAYLDHLHYFDDDQRSLPGMSEDRTVDIRSRLLVCAAVKHEVALSALLCEQGGSVLRSKSRQLRDALFDTEKTE